MKLRDLILYLSAVTIIAGCGKKESPVEPAVNHPPVIERIVANYEEAFTEDINRLECIASDEDGDILSYDWRSDGGYFDNVDRRQVIWNSPNQVGVYHITVKVDDGKNGTASMVKPLNVISRFDTVYVSEDAYVDEDYPNFNSQTDTSDSWYLWLIGANNNSKLNYPYLRFELGNNIGSISNAILNLETAGGAYPFENPSCYIYEVTQPWSERTITYYNQPDINPLPKFYFELPPTDTRYVFLNITSLVNDWINSHTKNYGFCIKPSMQMKGGYPFASKEGNRISGSMPMIILERSH